LERGIGSLGDVGLDDFWDGEVIEAESSLSGLIESCEEWDVESRNVVAQTDVEESLGMVVGWVKEDLSTFERPESAVVAAHSLVNTSTWVVPLCWHGVASPVWEINREMGGCDGGRSQKGEGGELHLGC